MNKTTFKKLNLMLSNGLFLTGAAIRPGGIAIISATDFTGSIRVVFDIEREIVLGSGGMKWGPKDVEVVGKKLRG
jgi:hypothetical protein